MEKGTFIFGQIFPVVPDHSYSKEVSFFGPEISDFGPKIRYTTPILANGPLVALGEMVYFQPLERFLTFRFRVIAVSIKNPADASKSLLLSHCVGIVCQ